MRKFFAVAAIAAAAAIAAPAFAALEQGATAPDFTATGMVGGKEFTFKLSDALKKGPVVMYFFPAAFTKGCTIETAAFADKAEEAWEQAYEAAQQRAGQSGGGSRGAPGQREVEGGEGREGDDEDPQVSSGRGAGIDELG